MQFIFTATEVIQSLWSGKKRMFSSLMSLFDVFYYLLLFYIVEFSLYLVIRNPTVHFKHHVIREDALRHVLPCLLIGALTKYRFGALMVLQLTHFSLHDVEM